MAFSAASVREFVLITSLDLEGLLLIEPRRHTDGRGYFSESFRHDNLGAAGFNATFLQENTVLTNDALTLRGLHYQAPPAAQDKLVCVVAGAVLDVVVDIRRGSSTYGMHFGVKLTAENGRQLLVPRGFAHGYLTLVSKCMVIYKVTDYYAPQYESGINAFDPQLSIDWGSIDRASVSLNQRDSNWGKFAEFESPFL